VSVIASMHMHVVKEGLGKREVFDQARSVVYCPFVHQTTNVNININIQSHNLTITMATNALNEYDKADTTTDDIPQGGDTVDNSYATSRNEPVPVLTDDTPVEQPNDTRDPDSDKALGEYLFILPSPHEYG
jgi:hypothetical protein